MKGKDRLIQGMAFDGDFRILAAQTTGTVETARARLDLSPVAADALGRAMTGAILLARLLEKSLKHQKVTLRFEGDGPIGIVIAEGTVSGTARGYVGDPTLSGIEDVREAVGSDGILTVVRGVPPLGKPYTSQVKLASGGIAQDLTHYLAASEQITSATMLGVLNRPSGVAAAGGVIVQAFPHTTPAAIEIMEEKIRQAPPLTSLIARMPIEGAVREIIGPDYKPLDESINVPLEYRCSCSRERALAPIALFSREEIEDMIHRENGSEVVCQFCGQKYVFSRDDLLALSASHDA